MCISSVFLSIKLKKQLCQKLPRHEKQLAKMESISKDPICYLRLGIDRKGYPYLKFEF